MASQATPRRSGSSPLTRGKRGHARPHPVGGGLIPAHAGKTPCPASSHSSRRAHPRSRGENGQAGGEATERRGSSPLTRGKHVEVGHGPEGHGLIPAHAGKTDRSHAGDLLAGAHPRSRGENRRSWRICSMILGSSPLTRGKLLGVQQSLDLAGLIPAHAGKTSAPPSPPGSAPAHPRSRGENAPGAPERSGADGSSPLTRGKRRGAGLT